MVGESEACPQKRKESEEGKGSDRTYISEVGGEKKAAAVTFGIWKVDFQVCLMDSEKKRFVSAGKEKRERA